MPVGTVGRRDGRTDGAPEDGLENGLGADGVR